MVWAVLFIAESSVSDTKTGALYNVLNTRISDLSDQLSFDIKRHNSRKHLWKGVL